MSNALPLGPPKGLVNLGQSFLLEECVESVSFFIFLTCIRICLMRSNAVSGGGTSGLPTAFAAFLDPLGLLPPPPPPPPTLLCFVGRAAGGGGEYREYGIDEASRCRLGLMICKLLAMSWPCVRIASPATVARLGAQLDFLHVSMFWNASVSGNRNERDANQFKAPHVCTAPWKLPRFFANVVFFSLSDSDQVKCLCSTLCRRRRAC